VIRGFSIRTRFVAATVGLLLMIGGVLVLYVQTALKERFAAQVQKRGVAIAHSYARMATNPSLTEDFIELQLLSFDIRNSEPDVEYLFIVNSHGLVVAHTFRDGLPASLLPANIPAAGESYRIQLLKTDRGAIYDIAVPILKGELGVAHLGLSSDSLMAGVRQITWQATGLVVVIILLASCGAVAVATSLTKPIKHLMDGVENVGAGNLHHRVEASGSDEVGQLAAAFNQMAEKLEATTVSRDEVEGLNRQLTATNRELEAFAYSVSHDLLAPLRHIEGFSTMLLEDHHSQLQDQGVHCLKRIKAGVVRMEGLIEALLKLSRISRADMHCREVDLSRIARSIVEQLREAAPGRTVDVTIADGLKAEGDEDLLRIVLVNLLENAWKYSSTRDLPRIEFGRQEVDGRSVFFVRDNGIGFDMKHVDKLFGVFRRLVSDSDFPGTGIGLATVLRVIARHGGEVWAEGEPDRGATFYFTLQQRLAQEHGE
jgi:signal transduction histidine kinase